MADLWRCIRVVLLVAGLLPATSGSAQTLGYSLGTPLAPQVRTIDQDRLYFESRFGRRVQADILSASQALEAENERLVAQLSARELELTEARAGLPPEEFRALADAFNDEAEAIRDDQARKSREIARFQEAEQLRFFDAVGPLLNELIAELGAELLIDSRAVLIAGDGVDLTDEAIARVDTQLGDGADAPAVDLPEIIPTPEPHGPSPDARDPPAGNDITPPLELPGPDDEP